MSYYESYSIRMFHLCHDGTLDEIDLPHPLYQETINELVDLDPEGLSEENDFSCLIDPETGTSHYDVYSRHHQKVMLDFSRWITDIVFLVEVESSDAGTPRFREYYHNGKFYEVEQVWPEFDSSKLEVPQEGE